MGVLGIVGGRGLGLSSFVDVGERVRWVLGVSLLGIRDE
jgi:hypothetical protein